MSIFISSHDRLRGYIQKNTVLSLFILLSLFSSFLNYATYPALARALPSSQFVDITVALSLLTQISSFLTSIVALTIGLSKQAGRETTKIIEKLQIILIQFFLAIVVIFLLISPLLLDKIRLSAIFLLPICLLMLSSIPISIISGFLNGKQKLIKLAMVAVISASLQFTLTVTTGFTTHSGSLALNAMALGQVLAIFVVYRLYRSENLPHVSTIFQHKLESFKTPEMKRLIKFTVLSSIGIMAINILQIIDLLIVQNRQANAKLYTDLYVISRVVFFAGAIFIWPFLSSVNIYQRRQNIAVFAKLVAALTILSLGAITGILLFGREITHILFGSVFKSNAISQLGVLAITYKYMYLLITALTLFFIVIRSYLAIILPIILTLGTVIFVGTLSSSTSTLHILYGLNAISVIGLGIGLGFFFKTVGSNVVESE